MERETPVAPKRYIVGPLYDWCWFLLPPVVSLAIGIAISDTSFSARTFLFDGEEVSASGLVIGTLIHAHLVAVFVRSHANPEIFRQHRWRFVLVPIVLLVALATSAYIAIAATVVATFWDVWHSGAQTFGFARIYDRNQGNPPELGRRLDFWLNQVVYAGPILGGVSLMDHVDSFAAFDAVDAPFFSSIPARVAGQAKTLTLVVVTLGGLFILYYLYAYWRFHRQGYRVSPLKIYLLVSTAACSIYSWGFNTWGEAFFIMNLFHAVQYLGLVWASESTRVLRRLRLEGRRYGRLIGGALGLAAVCGYGFLAKAANPSRELFWSVTIVVSLLHFWYDGFIWSVRKREI